MDMFMDKLAQKLTAQEMIKANMEADTEQLNKLKVQVKDYRECLEQVQKLTEAGITKMNQIENEVKSTGAQNSAEILSALENMERRLSDEQDASGKKCVEEMAALEKLYAEELLALKEQYTDELTELEDRCVEEIAALKAKNAEAIQKLEKLFSEKLDASDENVHKECVKVYRNVQAAVVEENGKQTDNLSEVINAAVKGYRGKLNAILTVSIISMILALGSVALHILQMMNFKFF